MKGEEVYWDSFIRNIGILTRMDQQRLRDCCVAVAGTGGVGGVYMATLARVGVGRFVISDPDAFDYSNINRQYGASVDTIGKNKALVMKEIVESINPSVQITVFEGGLTEENTDEFLEGTDLVLDSLDVYSFMELLKLYERAREKDLYVLKGIPLGFGATLLVFSPTGMSFCEYFGIDVGRSIDVAEVIADTKAAKGFYESFLRGYSPQRIHEKYLGPDVFNPFNDTGDFQFKPFPSFSASVHLCSALVSTEAVLLHLQKRPPVVVPECLQIDLFERTLHITEPGKKPVGCW